MLRKFFGLLCLFALPAAQAHAQPPVSGEIFAGTVVREKDGKPIAGAQVSIFAAGWLLQKLTSDANGAFSSAPLLMAASRFPNTSYAVLTIAPGYAPLAQSIGPTEPTSPFPIKLAEGIPVTVRVVDSTGKALGGSQIQLLGFDARPPAALKPRQGVAVTTYKLDSTIQKTGTDGKVALRSLPLAGTVSLAISQDGYASSIQNIDAESKSQIDLPLSRETVVSGKVLFADTKEPFVFPGIIIRARMRGFGMPRQADLGPDGTFQIRDIPSLELTGETSLGVFMDPGITSDEPRTEGSVSVSYAQFRRNMNVLVTRESKGAKRWYIGYGLGGESGLRYKEGERVQQDLLLQPLGRITGTLRTAAAPPPSIANLVVNTAPPPPRISYHDPRSVYGDWTVSPDENGHFEIFAPPGDVTLTIVTNKQRSQMVVTGLKAQETREIQVG